MRKRIARELFLACAAACGFAAAARAVGEAPAGYSLAWSDEFNSPSIDTSVWELLNLRDSYNNEKQYYLPQQASIAATTDPATGDPKSVLRITSTNQPFGGKQYRSARLESRTDTDHTVLYGRVDVLAKIPTTKGVWPAIWLFPNRDVPWPTGGEIDIMEHKGSIPNQVSSAYHYNNTPGTSSFRFHEYTATGDTGQPIVWPDGYHQYSIEWDPQEIRFYIDGYNHFTVVDDSAPTGYKPNEGYASATQRHKVPSTAMNVILNTAIGGDFDGDPNGSTVFPQQFDIDYVRVYDRVDSQPRLANGGFDTADSQWLTNSNASIADAAGNNPALRLTSLGAARQYLYGPLAGATYEATALVLPETGAGSGQLRVAFFGASNQTLGVQTATLSLPGGAAAGPRTVSLEATAPAGSVYATLEVRGGAGVLWADSLTWAVAPPPVAGDYNDDGVVDAADYTVWRDNFGSRSNLAADGNGDGAVGGADYGVWAAGYGASAAVAVPEPASLLTLALALGAAACPRR